MQISLRKFVVSALASGAAVAVLSQASAEETRQLPTVYVTGSNIPGPDLGPASPMQVLTARDLEKTGYTTVWQALNDLSANGQGAVAHNFGGSGAWGANGISLRGLNVGATLVLIDGFRMATHPGHDDGQRAFVDLTSIPLDAVERIEVLKDGASAIYGSDAIAGVVNVVLLKTFAGTRLTANAGTSSRRDGTEGRLALTTGKGNLGSDGFNAYISAEVRGQDVIRFADRGGSLSQTDYTSRGGYDVTPGVPNPLNGGLPESTTGYVTDAGGRIVGFMPGCDSTRLNAARCAFRDTWSQVQPNAKTYSALSRLTLVLSPGWQASFQAGYTGSEAEIVVAPATSYPEGFQGVNSGPGRAPTLNRPLPPTTISSRNPSFPAGIGGSGGTLHYTFADLGPAKLQSVAGSTRLIAAIDGSAAGWNIGAAGGSTNVRLRVRSQNVTNPANLQQALDSTNTPYLVGQRNDPSVLSFVAPEAVTTQTSRLDFLRLTGRKEILPLPGGSLQVAIGGELQRRRINALTPAAEASGEVVAFGNTYVVGSQHVASLYGELQAPVSNALALEVAARYDHYNTLGGRLSPKIGSSWKVSPEFGLRATAGRGFRAPGPSENGTAGTTFYAGTSNDPVLCPSGDPARSGVFPSQCTVRVATLISSNPKLMPETSTSFNVGLDYRPASEFGMSLDFFSIDVRNQIVVGESGDVVRGTNLAPIPQLQPNGTFVSVAPAVAPISYYQLSYVNANRTRTTGADFHVRLQQRLKGIGRLTSDFTLTYVAKYDLQIGDTVHHLAGTHGPLGVSGNSGNPRTRFRWVNTFESGRWSISGTWNYIGGFNLTDPSSGINDCASGLTIGAGRRPFADLLQNGTVPPGVDCRVSSFSTFDLVGSFQVTKQFLLRASVLNVLDSRPPLDWGTFGGAGQPYNRVLHSKGGIGRFFGLTAQYAF